MYTPITERKAAATNIAGKVLVSLECHTSIIRSFFDGFTYSFPFFSQPGLHCTPLRQRMSLMLLKEQQSLIASHWLRHFIQCRNKVGITPPCLLKCNAWWKGHWDPSLVVLHLLLQTGVLQGLGQWGVVPTTPNIVSVSASLGRDTNRRGYVSKVFPYGAVNHLSYPQKNTPLPLRVYNSFPKIRPLGRGII